MKFGKTYTNKLISYVDRYFTYDTRTMRREKSDSLFDFFGVCENNGVHTIVVVDRLQKDLLWVSISKGDDNIHSGFMQSFDDIKNFKRMIRCLG